MGSLAIIFSIDVLVAAICIRLTKKFSFVKAEFNGQITSHKRNAVT
jgi:hypothetical protein